MKKEEIKKVQLDELELMIGLIQVSDPSMHKATYSELQKALFIEFGIQIDYDDIFLLYEPTIEDEIIDSEVFYKGVFNY